MDINKLRTWLMVVFLFLCGGQSATAQNTTSAEPESITNEILRLESLRLSNPSEFGIGLKKISDSQDQMSAYQLCHFQFLLAYQTAFAGQSQKAIETLEQIIPHCADLRARIRQDALIANISAISGHYDKASKHIDRTIQNAEQITDIKTKIIAYVAASMVYNLLDQKELSVKYSELLYSLVPSTENQCRLQYSKNMHHLDGNQLAADFSEIESSAQLCKDSGNLLFAQSILLDDIKRKLVANNFDDSSFEQMQTIIENLRPEIAASPYKNIQAVFSAIEAKIAYLHNDYDAALSHGLATLELNQDLGNTEQQIMALEVLELVAKSKGDYAKSYDYLALKNKAELEMYDQSQAKQMAFMAVKHSNLAKVFEIEQLNQQKEVLELEKKLTRQEANNQRLVILLILTLLGLLLLWMLKIKKRHDYFKDVSEIDHLTKVLTRKAFEDQVNNILTKCQNENRPVHVSIMDLDHFKDVNDNHGHLIGDWVLKNVIYACKELIEENMIIARLGGEEFCIVMTDISCDELLEKLENMRFAIESLDCRESGADLSVTASFGVTSSITSGYSLPLLLTHADVALFEAKKSGRNRVVKFKTLVKNK